jgi:hypothetical protein
MVQRPVAMLISYIRTYVPTQYYIPNNDNCLRTPSQPHPLQSTLPPYLSQYTQTTLLSPYWLLPHGPTTWLLPHGQRPGYYHMVQRPGYCHTVNDLATATRSTTWLLPHGPITWLLPHGPMTWLLPHCPWTSDKRAKELHPSLVNAGACNTYIVMTRVYMHHYVTENYAIVISTKTIHCLYTYVAQCITTLHRPKSRMATYVCACA